MAVTNSSIRVFGFSGLLLFLLFASCSPEHKLAKKYVNNHKGSVILIIPLYDLYKDNLTISYDTNAKYSSDQFDSIAWVQSYYIQYISDSVFLTTFTNSLISGLTATGYDVYLDSGSDVFLSLPDPKWVIQIGKLQMNEDHKTEYRDMYSIESGETYTQEYRLNQINLESWFEVSQANSDEKQVLYLEGYIQDKFKTKIGLDVESGGFGVISNRDSLQMDDIYRMAEASGKKHAALLFDYFMNKYIDANLPLGNAKREYYRYNPESN